MWHKLRHTHFAWDSDTQSSDQKSKLISKSVLGIYKWNEKWYILLLVCSSPLRCTYYASNLIAEEIKVLKISCLCTQLYVVFPHHKGRMFFFFYALHKVNSCAIYIWKQRGVELEPMAHIGYSFLAIGIHADTK